MPSPTKVLTTNKFNQAKHIVPNIHTTLWTCKSRAKAAQNNGGLVESFAIRSAIANDIFSATQVLYV